MKKRIWIPILSLIVLVIICVCIAGTVKENYEEDFVSIKSEDNLNAIMDLSNGKTMFQDSSFTNVVINMLLAPWNAITGDYYGSYYSRGYKGYDGGIARNNAMVDLVYEESAVFDMAATTSSAVTSGTMQKLQSTKAEVEVADDDADFSKTNVQVENVDEADTIKTDGNYIYSFSESSVIITDAKEMNVVKKIDYEYLIPEDMILYNDKLVVILAGYSDTDTTTICTYDITDKSNPVEKSKVCMDGSYYTSRRINEDVFVITSTYVYDKFEPIYMFNDVEERISYNSLKYQRCNITRSLTYIASFDMTKCEEKPDINGYFMNISEAYVSQDNIYVMSGKYEYSYNEPKIKDMFGPWGIMGLFIKANSSSNDYGYKTQIKKFNIENGKIKYDCKGTVDGRTVNQFSFDEYDSMFRIALTDEDTNGVVILDKKLNKIGELTGLAKGEQIYSSRFIGTRLYLVTYKTTDPLFVIDLADAKEPKVLGELKISGYSTYLHPYDENHIIGIGRETEERINKDAFGRVTSTWAINKGLKMALFDVADVENPKQISTVTIGDSSTYSSILENHKALLFSKEKNLIAIPVNSFDEETTTRFGNDYDSLAGRTDYVKSGFIVYDITLDKGFVKKGTIMHEGFKDNSDYKWYWYRNNSPVRGLYIGDILYTVSDEQIFANKLENLQLVKKIDLKTIEGEE